MLCSGKQKNLTMLLIKDKAMNVQKQIWGMSHAKLSNYLSTVWMPSETPLSLINQKLFIYTLNLSNLLQNLGVHS